MRGFPEALDAWGVVDDPARALDDLISAAARLLANHHDEPLVYCHSVTAPAAVQMVFDEIPESLRAPTVASLWTVFGGLVAAYGWRAPASELDDPAEDEPPQIDDLAASAIENGDEHVLKLTEAVARQITRTGDTALLFAAERFTQRWAPIPDSRRSETPRRPPKLREDPARRGMIVELGPHSQSVGLTDHSVSMIRPVVESGSS